MAEDVFRDRTQSRAGASVVDRSGASVVDRSVGDSGRHGPVAGVPTAAGREGVDLQTQLTRAYLSGNGAEVERLLALIAAAEIVLPPKSRAAA